MVKCQRHALRDISAECERNYVNVEYLVMQLKKYDYQILSI